MNETRTAARTGPVGPVDAEGFRAAMSCFPAGVVLVTTREEDGTPRGFTASSFCSVSLAPPLVSVCQGTGAQSYGAFQECARFAVSVLRSGQRELASRFATRGADKFGGGGLVALEGSGLLVAADALVTLECAVHARHPAGDHVILVGEVRGVGQGEGEPLVHWGRGFRALR
ncbi:flavin reductase family protein [Streptomyces sp. AM 3-1-1]|uniref:flavin reductase family protein n=1 Tax=Streptomyces sp. AM 3-1-1 TaxID=3028711 RepID=UPI0023B89992|nr:flavin reductase family protein [Streptomyces sp. AM 3-1-1]WEH30868.1 flavin reductase family protein [Streptomyces sp. AM 3-1-1]